MGFHVQGICLGTLVLTINKVQENMNELKAFTASREAQIDNNILKPPSDGLQPPA